MPMEPFFQKLRDRPINGRYTLVERLGKGGFGVVYLGMSASCDSEPSAYLQ